ncbi:MAG TPA: energy transducer TonB [Burkholderiales bacterium]|jgi:colicin import membrane protein|nr:energy transducer TonB [Burkholderiales bacterium]
MSYAIQADEPGSLAPAALSALVHGVLLAMLVVGLHWQTRYPDAVQVELWSQLPEVESPPKVEPTPAPKPEVKPPEPKVEQKAAKPDIAIEREKKAPKKKEEPPLKFDTTSRNQQQLAQELKALQARERQDVVKQFSQPPAAGLPDAGYIDKIRTKIKANIYLPSEVKGNPEVVFSIVQLPTFEVLSVRLVKTSGNALLDAAVERAILKSSPLPKPDRPEQWLREFNISFKPLE